MIQRAAGVILAVLAVGAAQAGGSLRLELLGGEMRLPGNTVVEGTLVGGLSGLAYDPARDLYLAVSDDKGDHGPARFYTLMITIPDRGLQPGAVRVLGVTPLRDDTGATLPVDAVDLEGIALAPDGSVLVSSEGNHRTLTPPFLRRLTRDGRVVGSLAVPDHYLPREGGGCRHNRSFESLAVTPDGATLVTALESALVQDGPEASFDQGSPARILLLDLASGAVRAEYLYLVEPVRPLPQPYHGSAENGLAEVVAVTPRRLLALERGYAEGVGSWACLYEVSLEGATDISGPASLRGVDPAAIRPVTKRLLLDLSELGIPLDNLEGMAFGPLLPDGRRALILVSDDNFNRETQHTQFLAFAVSGLDPVADPRRVHDLQGRSHQSPLAGERVAEVEGLVTAVEPDGGRWIQDPVGDGDDVTSEGLLVRPAPGQEPVRVGDLVAVTGTVAELGGPGELTVTAVVDATLELRSRDNPLPTPILLGDGGRPVPDRVVDDDGLAVFEPASDGADWFESLEGMRVEVRDPLVVGPTSEFGELVVVADGGRHAGPRSARGGLLATEVDPNPERIAVRVFTGPPLPDLRVGETLAGSLTGVLGYDHGRFKLLLTSPLPAVAPTGVRAETTELGPGPGRVTVATFNVENLSAKSSEDKLARVARVIALDLRSPDIVALQEIQDDSGPADDGEVSARKTLTRLVRAVEAAGGPLYQWRQVDPENNADGGQPGGNIRVALLANPGRARFVDRGQASSTDSTELTADGRLTRSPGRVAARHPAFVAGSETSGEGGRKPLVAELEVDGRRLVVVDLHLRSKWGDDPEYGQHQPPRRSSEAQRRDQALAVNAFVHRLLTVDRQLPLVVLGDLNEHLGRPPVRALAGSELVDLVDTLPLEEQYTYVFDGNSRVLDHILVSSSLVAGAEVDVVHVDAELPASERASDHDPVVARLVLPSAAR